MTHLALDSQAARLLAHLHRGGAYAYWWAVKDAKKTSIWWTPGRPSPMPNSQHNVYFGVNPCSTIPPTNAKGEKTPPAGVRSQVAYIAAINCLFAEFDAKHFEGGKAAALAHIEALDPSPSAVVDSGGGFHCYWLLTDPFLLSTEGDRARADRGQKGWVKRVGSDDGAKDLARVLRVPGTQNFKPEYGPDFPAVRFVWADFGLLYTLDALEALLPPEPAPKERTPRRTLAAPDEIQDETGDASDFDAIAQAALNLKRLSARRRDAYGTWINVGMALRELGSIGYELWEKWSRPSPKYEVGACREHWRTFKPGAECDGLTLDSLARWAQEDDPESAPTVPEEAQRELTDLRQRVSWEQKILNCKGLKPTEKGVFVGLYDIIAAHRHLAGNDDRVPLDYGYAAQVLSTSKTTVGNVVDIGEKVGLWRKDPEVVTGDDGYEIKRMRLELQPAYDAPPQHADLDRPKHGGARPGAGRRPKCKECPAGTVHRMRTERTVSYHCPNHGLIKAETLPALVEDYVPDEFQDETERENVVTSVSSFAAEAETSDRNQDETEESTAVYSVSNLHDPASEIQDETGKVGDDEVVGNLERGLAPPPADIQDDCQLPSLPVAAPTSHSNDYQQPVSGPTRIGDALVNLGYIQNRLQAHDLAAIETHCLLAGITPDVAIEAAQRAAQATVVAKKKDTT